MPKKIKDKSFIYLSNSLFILFDENDLSPEIAGEKVALALQNALLQLYPNRKGSNGAIANIREEWFGKFYKSFSKVLKKVNKLNFVLDKI